MLRYDISPLDPEAHLPKHSWALVKFLFPKPTNALGVFQPQGVKNTKPCVFSIRSGLLTHLSAATTLTTAAASLIPAHALWKRSALKQIKS